VHRHVSLTRQFGCCIGKFCNSYHPSCGRLTNRPYFIYCGWMRQCVHACSTTVRDSDNLKQRIIQTRGNFQQSVIYWRPVASIAPCTRNGKRQSLWTFTVTLLKSTVANIAVLQVLQYLLQYFLWLPCLADADIIFLPCSFFLSSIFYSSPNLSGRRLDDYHTSTHGVALVRI